MEKTLQIEEFLSELHQTGSDVASPIQKEIEDIMGESVTFIDNRVTALHIFSLQIALQINCLKSVIPIGFYVTQKAIFEYLQSHGLDSTAKLVDNYVKIKEVEERNNLFPLSGVSLQFLRSIVTKEHYEELIENKTTENGNISQIFMHSFVHVTTRLVELSTDARERNMK